MEVSEGEDAMHENPETSIHSARALMEHSQKKAKETREREAVNNKTFQLTSEQIALLKESNELARKALTEANLRLEQEKAWRESNSTDVVDLKPNFFGLGANLNELWRRFKKWRSK
jgi:hypothetical protein